LHVFFIALLDVPKTTLLGSGPVQTRGQGIDLAPQFPAFKLTLRRLSLEVFRQGMVGNRAHVD
jgi:hypothetical protein